MVLHHEDVDYWHQKPGCPEYEVAGYHTPPALIAPNDLPKRIKQGASNRQ
jgi:hypothetical protein